MELKKKKKKKKAGARFAALRTRTLQFLSQSSPSSNCDLGKCPQVSDQVSLSSQLSVLREGDGVGELAPRDCRQPGYSTLQVHAVPQPSKLVAPDLPTSSASGSAQSSLFRFPRGVPRLCSALPPPVCVSLLGRDLAIILPSAEKRSIYP